MKVLLFLLISIAGFLSTSGQEIKSEHKQWTPTGDHTCVYDNKYAVAQRLKMYPFNIADTIKLISFRYHKDHTPVTSSTVLRDSLIEITVLTKSDVIRLTDILYNNHYRTKPNYGTMQNCFLPRNAILFYNKAGQLQEYVLICFHCSNYKLSSQKVKAGDDCQEKMSKLNKFFISRGIKFGTDKSIENYKGEDTGE